ncbi:Putative uncharacterized protein [Moritella viscosa]|uniref:tail fiber assembly protein n=1 Tax=Moritella viscosa TaxID=80854 RepID=UPI0009137BF8|nr:tail fiber assembly protein [Moritella viscosa]SGY86886.1 Putative uncharacterized protein [Moritella viscosa]
MQENNTNSELGYLDAEMANETKWSTVRVIRDAKLKATDWLVIKYMGSGESLSDAWKQYRSTLRDIPQSGVEPDAIVWPQKPAIS